MTQRLNSQGSITSLLGRTSGALHILRIWTGGVLKWGKLGSHGHAERNNDHSL
jgi:hypothetical protein